MPFNHKISAVSSRFGRFRPRSALSDAHNFLHFLQYVSCMHLTAVMTNAKMIVKSTICPKKSPAHNNLLLLFISYRVLSCLNLYILRARGKSILSTPLFAAPRSVSLRWHFLLSMKSFRIATRCYLPSMCYYRILDWYSRKSV